MSRITPTPIFQHSTSANTSLHQEPNHYRCKLWTIPLTRRIHYFLAEKPRQKYQDKLIALYAKKIQSHQNVGNERKKKS